MVGFPHPSGGHEAQPPFKFNLTRPKGLQDEDWEFAKAFQGGLHFLVPRDLSVYFFLEDGAISQELVRSWFKFQPSLQDGATKGAYQIFGLQGDHGVLQHPWRRTEFFWALANHTWSAGVLRADPQTSSPITASLTELAAYQQACHKLGHGQRSVSLFDESIDTVLQELDRDPNMIRIPNINWEDGLFCVNENWTSGNAAASIGLDIRMYADKASSSTNGSAIGCRIVCAVRFGNNPGIKVHPGGAAGVHGGAIQSVMDEITAQCVRYWAVPGCTTRKISHTISGRVFQFQTYKCECKIDNVQNDGCILVSKATLRDPLGKPVCVSASDMLDFAKMSEMQRDPA